MNLLKVLDNAMETLLKFRTDFNTRLASLRQHDPDLRKPNFEVHIDYFCAIALRLIDDIRDGDHSLINKKRHEHPRKNQIKQAMDPVYEHELHGSTDILALVNSSAVGVARADDSDKATETVLHPQLHMMMTHDVLEVRSRYAAKTSGEVRAEAEGLKGECVQLHQEVEKLKTEFEKQERELREEAMKSAKEEKRKAAELLEHSQMLVATVRGLHPSAEYQKDFMAADLACKEANYCADDVLETLEKSVRSRSYAKNWKPELALLQDKAAKAVQAAEQMVRKADAGLKKQAVAEAEAALAQATTKDAASASQGAKMEAEKASAAGDEMFRRIEEMLKTHLWSSGNADAQSPTLPETAASGEQETGAQVPEINSNDVTVTLDAVDV